MCDLQNKLKPTMIDAENSKQTAIKESLQGRDGEDVLEALNKVNRECLGCLCCHAATVAYLNLFSVVICVVSVRVVVKYQDKFALCYWWESIMKTIFTSRILLYINIIKETIIKNYLIQSKP